MSTDNSDIVLVEDCVRTLIDKFRIHPYYFGSEYDLRSYLYHLIISKEPFGKEYLTRNGYSIGLVYAEYPTIARGFFDLALLDRKSISQLTLKDQRILCGIEIGLNRSYEHFEKDCAGLKFVRVPENNVSIGYILHFVRGSHKDWNTVAQFGRELTERTPEEEITQNDFRLLKLIESDEAKVLAVKIIVRN